jgi:hypothetical protein
VTAIQRPAPFDSTQTRPPWRATIVRHKASLNPRREARCHVAV